MTRDNLIDWTLEELHEIENFADEEEALLNRKMIGLIVERMREKEGILLQTFAVGPSSIDMTNDENAESNYQASNAIEDHKQQRAYIIVHPNYSMDTEDI